MERSRWGIRKAVQAIGCAVLGACVLVSCQGHYSPKPRGYFRIEYPEKSYQPFDSSCPYTFRFPAYAQMEPDLTRDAQPCWMDVYFPGFNARIHLSYMPIADAETFNELVEDARTFAFNHTVKATAIDQRRIDLPERRVHGMVYSIRGNTASSIQFFLTDSTDHYLRGSLYFNERPQLDSIQPIIEFLRPDIDTLIHSLRWK